jgi:hypothetical protein
MKIPQQPISTTSRVAPARPVATPPAASPAQPTAGGDGPTSRAARTDQVQISPEARTRAAGHTSPADGELSAERIASLRQRLADNYYDGDDAIDAIAHRIVDQGVLHADRPTGEANEISRR